MPELVASAAVHYDAWERAISDVRRPPAGQPRDSLYPLAVGRAILAACRAAYDRWSARADADLTVYLDAALRALGAGLPTTCWARSRTFPRWPPEVDRCSNRPALAPSAGLF